MTKRKAAPKSVVGYVRVSTEEQSREGVSLEAQESRIRSYCDMRGLALVDVVVDAGVSGGKALSTRGGGVRVLEALRTGSASGVVAVKLDRLFRSASDCLATVESWDKSGVGLHLVDMGGASIDTTTSTGKLFLTMLSGFAEFERSIIAERTSAALQHKKANGERTGGAIGYGFRLSNDGVHVEPEPAEQATIERARTLSRGGLSLRAIAAKLEAEGMFARNGFMFQAQQIKNILDTPSTEPTAAEAPKPQAKVLEAVERLAPQYRAKLVPIHALRKVLSMPKAELDALLLDMAAERLIDLDTSNDPQAPDVLKHGVASGIDQRPTIVDGKRTDGRGLLWFVTPV